MTERRDDDSLAGEFVLGLLEGEAKREAERRLASDAVFAREVESWRLRFGEFDAATPAQPAGNALWSRIEAAVLGGARQSSKQPPAWQRWWDNIALWRTSALAAALGALALAVGLGYALRAAHQQPTMIAVLLDGNRAGAVVQTFADGRVVLVPIAAFDVPAGRALQVWTLPSRERGPVSVGLMERARTLELSLHDLPAPRIDQLFEITLEPVTGSPTGRPTGPVLFKGNTAQAL